MQLVSHSVTHFKVAIFLHKAIVETAIIANVMYLIYLYIHVPYVPIHTLARLEAPRFANLKYATTRQELN